MFKRLRDASDEENKSMEESINGVTKLKNIVKNVPKDEVSKFEKFEKIIDIAERILELNSKKTSFRLKNINTRPNASYITYYFSTVKSKK